MAQREYKIQKMLSSELLRKTSSSSSFVGFYNTRQLLQLVNKKALAIHNVPRNRRSVSLFHSTALSVEPSAATGGTPTTQINTSNNSNNNNSNHSKTKTTTPKQKQKQPQQQRKFHSLNEKSPYQLCFLRHGQSTWNRDNRFIGWTDTPLTDDGVLEARVAGQMLHRSGMKFDEVHTSLLRRCIRTANLVLMETQQEYIPIYKHWRLNERHYGDLVGKNKKEVVKVHGKDQVKRWRRAWDEPPPPMADDHEYHPALDPRYREVCIMYHVVYFLTIVSSY